MKRIFVSGASTVIGYGILRSLRSLGPDYILVGSSIYDDSIAEHFCDIFIVSPLTEEENYIPWLIGILKDQKIDVAIPSFDEDVYCWSKNKRILENTGAKIALNNSELISFCKDKWLIFNELNNHKCSCIIPTTTNINFEYLSNEYGLPLILKPRRGSGSKGVLRIHSRKEFDLVSEPQQSELIAQPLIGDDNEEYTTSAFCNGKGGFESIISLKRKLSKQGVTGVAEVVEEVGIEDAVRELCQILNPLGSTNFQFRKVLNKFYLLEINPRISSATSIRTAFGYNEGEMLLEYYLNKKMPVQPKLKKGKAVRFLEDFIIYE